MLKNHFCTRKNLFFPTELKIVKEKRKLVFTGAFSQLFSSVFDLRQ